MFLTVFALFAKATDGNHWQFNINAENTMTCTAVLYIDGVSMQNDANAQSYEIGAFIDDECVSSYIPDAFPSLPFVSGYGYNFMFHSDNASGTITFRVYNHQTGQEMECTHNCPTTLEFVKDGNQGNLVNLFHIELFTDPTIICYDIDATANPAVGGSVTGAGLYKPGRTCKLTATPNTGYDFVNWTKDTEVVSTNAVYLFTASEDAEYVANFQIKTYAITVTADPEVGGTVTGAGTYDCGATCTLTASPSTGHQFVNWTKGGVEVSTEAEYSFTVEEDAAFVAHFTSQPYEITASVNPLEGGTATVEGTLTYGTTCTLTATPAEHYAFVNWTLGGEVVSTDAVYEFTVTGDGAYVANFELASYEITATVNPAGTGTVTGAGSITYGQTCTLTAEANGGYEFTNWTKGGVEVSTDASYTFTVYEAANYVANFAPKIYHVTVAASPAEGGFVSRKPEPILGDIYDYGQQVKLRAVPKLGYEFVNWTKSNPINMDEPEITITVNDDNSGAYTANFQTVELPVVPTQTHWTSVDGLLYTMNITGIMVLDGESMKNNDVAQYLEIGAFVGEECRGSFLPTTYDLPFAQGYYYEMTINGNNSGEQVVFRVWNHIGGEELDVTSLSNTTFIADANLGDLMTPHELEFETNLIAHYNIVATANIPEAGTVTGSGSYEEDTECTLVATANEHYNFVNWTKGDEVVSTNATYAFTVTANGTYVANFEPMQYEITVADLQHGTVEGAGTYAYNTQCVLTATPDEGYHFVNWTKGGVEVSTEASYAFVVEADASYVATFAINTYDIAVTVSPYLGEENSCGSVTGAGNFEHFATCTLTATPATKWVFENWTENEVIITDEAGDPVGAEYTFTVTGPRNIVANFAPIYTITASVDKDIEVAGVEPGTIEGAGDVIKGQIWTLTETPDAGYTFATWYEVIGDERVPYSTEATISEEAQADREFVAYYTLNSYDITATITPDEVPATATEITVAGTVAGTGSYHHYDECTLTATPETGYHFVNWTETIAEETVVVATEAEYTFTVDGSRDLVANFELDTHEITATVADVTTDIPEAAPEVPGTVTGTGTYNYYDMCTMVATPEVGYHFVNWTENDVEVATTETYEFMVTADRALVANFELDTHDITVTIVDVTIDKPAAAPDVPGTVTGDATYNYYATCTMVATPEVGYHFVNWTENDVEVSTDATYEFMVTEDRDIVANFELDTHVITLSVADVTEDIPAAAPAVPGTVTGADSYNYYATCTVVATPEVGYHFVNWTEGGTEVATTETYEFMVEGDRELVANFELDTYEIVAEINPAETPDNDPDPAGVTTGAGSYMHYATCELTATANTGYTLVNWTLNDVEVSTEPTISFTVEGPETYVANFEINTYAITVFVTPDTTPAAAPEVAGTVTAEGYVFDDNHQITLEHFATCALTATPSEGYHFVNWTDENGEVVEYAEAIYSFTVTGARYLVANFALNEYNITATVLPETTPSNGPAVAGTVTGTGIYEHYSTCTLEATPSEGYHFMYWKVNDVVVETETTYSFMVTGACNVVAVFELNSYMIAATDNPTGYGTITGTGTYTHYATCTLVGTAGEGHTFFNWTENDVEVSTNATYSFTVTGPRTLVAHFINRYAITVAANPTVGGTVTGGAIYNEGTSVTLTATPATGYHFVNWTKNGTVVTTNTSYSFTVEAAADFVANFELNSYEITATLDPANAGTVTGAGTYNHFATCTLTANPSSSYLFVNWTKNGQVVSTEPTISFTVEGPAAYVAHFIPNTYVITASASPAYAGTVSGAGTYYYLTEHTLTATPNNGFHFVNWTKDGQVVSTEASLTITVTQDETYVANFESNVYQITVFANPSVGGSISGSGTYNYGQTCVLEAAPNEGYHFLNWTDANNEVVSTSLVYMFNVYNNAAFVANFEINSYEITAVANPVDGGTVEGAGTYNLGASATLTATASTGYTFVNWTKDNEVVSINTSYTFTVTEAGDYIANFELNSYEITAAANPAEGGTVEGAGTYNFGESCTLTATANTGYTFVNWTKGNEIVSTDASFTFTVTEDADYVANFEEIIIPTYEVTVTVSPENYGTVEGGGVYEEGETCTITATPSTGHIFVHWTENGEVVSENAEYSFLVTADHDFVAVFDVDGVGEYSNLVFNIYPNPATEKVVVESNEFIRRCEVYSVNGALMVTMYECTETFEINVSEYAPGSYVIRLISDSSVQTRRFIKK